jgi:hypothetical protein
MASGIFVAWARTILFILVGLAVAGFLVFGRAAEEQAGGWEEKISAKEGEFLVRVEPRQKKVEVRRVGAAPGAPPYLRIRIHRKEARPLEVRLKTLEVAQSPVRYSGRIDHWSESYTGVELEFSFDKKTWKRLGDTVLRAFR